MPPDLQTIPEPAREVAVAHRTEVLVVGSGIGREFEDRAVAMGAARPDSQSLSHEIDAEGVKLAADGLVAEAGVHPMLHRLFVAPVMDGETILGAIVESKAGREAIIADRVIDATGDADVAHRAGAPTVKTPPEAMQAASVLFHLSGLDKRAFLEGVRLDPQTYADWSAGEWAVQTAGKEDDLFSPFLRKRFDQAIRDGVIPADLSTIAGTWGSEADVRGEARFADSVGIYPEFIDGYGVLVLPTTGRYMHVPYRATLPKRVRGLLVTGRAIGGDRIAHAATRNMACCTVAGQGAGVAAAISLRTGEADLARVDIGQVQSELDRQGVRHA